MRRPIWIALLLLGSLALVCQAAPDAPADPKVTLSFKQETIPAALTALFRQAGLSYRLEGVEAGALQGTITSQLVDAPLPTAVRLVLRQAKPALVSRRESNGSYVFSLPPAAATPNPPLSSPVVPAPLPRSDKQGLPASARLSQPAVPSPPNSRFPLVRTVSIHGREPLQALHMTEAADFWLNRSTYKPYAEEIRLKLTTAAGPLSWDEIESFKMTAAAIGLDASFRHKKGRPLKEEVRPVLAAIDETMSANGYTGLSKDVQGLLEASAFSYWVCRNFYWDDSKDSKRVALNVDVPGLINSDLPSGTCMDCAIFLRETLREAAMLSGSGASAHYVHVARIRDGRSKGHAICGVKSAGGILWPVDPPLRVLEDYQRCVWDRFPLASFRVCPMSEAEWAVFMVNYADENDISQVRYQAERKRQGKKVFPLTGPFGDPQVIFNFGNTGPGSRGFKEWERLNSQRAALAPLTQWLEKRGRG
jgi:hypothetical protein